MFLSCGDGYLGDLPELHQGCQVPFLVSGVNVGFFWRHCSGKGTSTTGYSFCFCSISSFFLELFLHSSPVAYWAPTYLGSSFFRVLSSLLFHTVRGILKARILKCFAILFSSGPRFVRILHYDLSILGGPTWHGL